MANPQRFTPIPNDILEALARVKLSPYEWRVLMVIMRKTYGWGKKRDKMSQTQIVEATGIAPTHVSRALKSLDLKLIVTGTGKKQLGIQEDFKVWLQKLPELVTEVTSRGKKKLPELVTTKEKKETIQKKMKTRVRACFPPTIPNNGTIELLKQQYPEIDVALEWEACMDHFRAKGEKRLDWNATFRNWLRNQRKWAKEKQPQTTGSGYKKEV